LYTSVVSYQNMSFHTPWYVIIPTIVISYHTGMSSYPQMSFHTDEMCVTKRIVLAFINNST
jgi:hypothetical protein